MAALRDAGLISYQLREARPQSFDDTVRTARLWKPEYLKDKRLVAKPVFAGRVA